MKTLKLILFIILITFNAKSQDLKTLDYIDTLKINGLINFNSSLTELYRKFGEPTSRYSPDYEMCGDGFDTIFYFNGITFYYLNWNKRNINTENPDYIWLDCVHFNPDDEIAINTGKVALTKNTLLDEIRNTYPISYRNRITKDSETVIKISACKECHEDAYFTLFFNNERLVKITYYSSDC